MSVTLIAGSRSINDYDQVAEIIDYAYNSPTLRAISEVIEGGAPGVDSLARRWAKRNGLPVIAYPADWQRHGNRAGYLRNVTMGDKCEQAIVIWDGISRGTRLMIDYLLELGKPMVLVVAP